MPTGSKYMGWWGSMGGPKQKGITVYTISPMRANPMKGAFSHWLMNGSKRLVQQAPYFAIPIAGCYAIIEWAASDNHLRNSKAGHIQGKFA